jgi:hypothetical protein
MDDFSMFFNFSRAVALKKMNASEKDGAGEADGEGKPGRMGRCIEVGGWRKLAPASHQLHVRGFRTKRQIVVRLVLMLE